MDKLNPNELEAMRILWDADAPQKPAEIQEQFSWAIDNGTLRSVLRVLMDKNFVTRRKEGKAFVYKAKATRERLMKRMLRQMAHVFTGGSRDGLILHLVESEELSPAALEELKKIAAGKESKKSTGGGK